MPRELFTAQWYPWYPDAVMESERVQKLSLAEECAYRRALDKQWKKGSLPADPKEFADQVGKNCTVKIAIKILEFFAPVRRQPARVANITLEQIRATQRLKYVSHRQRGIKGAASRWEKETSPDSTANGTAIAIPMAAHDRGEEMRGEERRGDSSSSFRSRGKNEEAIQKLKTEKRFAHLDIDLELDRCIAWCAKHDRQVTQKNFISWLEKVQPVIADIPPAQPKAKGASRNGTVDYYALEQERALEERRALERLREIDRGGPTTLPGKDDHHR